MKRAFLLILLIFSLTSTAQDKNTGTPVSRTGTIRGTVVEAKSGNPIYGASALIKGTMLGAATDAQGRFIIPHVSPGVVVIRITAMGYQTDDRVVTIVPNAIEELTFVLPETVLLFDGVTITASRYQQSVEDVPVSLNLIPAQEIAQRNIVSVDQALRYVPGVNAMDGGQVTIRGSSGFNLGLGSRVLVLYNGNPMMTGDNWNINWYAIPTTHIKQIEVMKGSGSALYGSSAMGGVINIITEDPAQGSHIQIRTFSGFHSKPSYSEWRISDKPEHFEGTSADFSTRIGLLSVILSSNYQNTTGYKENDDHQIFSLMTNLGYRFNPGLRLDLMAGYGINTGGFFIYWKDLAHPYMNGSDPLGYQTRSELNTSYVFPSLSFTPSQRINITLKGRLSTSLTEDHLRAKTPDLPESPEAFRQSEVNSQGGEVQVNFQATREGILVAGGDVQHDEVQSIQYGSRAVTRASYYTQWECRLWKKLKYSLGIRYDGEQAHEYGTEGELSKKAGLIFTPSPGTTFRTSLGEGFRTPAIAERFVSTYTSGIRVSPNPNLEPERSFSTELGVRHSLTKSMNIDLAFFYAKYSDLIEPQLDTDPDQTIVIRFKNVEQARIQGFDLSYRAEWYSGLISNQIGYTFLDSQDLSPGPEYGQPLKYRSKHMFYVTGDFMVPPLSFGMDFRFLSRISRIDEYHKSYIKDIDHRVPTFVTSLRLGFVKQHFSFRFIIDNLLQYNYLLSPANMGQPRTAVLQLNFMY